jgi:anti-sigma factor RsiW
MTCRDVVELLADYLSDELPADERRRLGQHLAECPGCLAYLQTYEATIRLAKYALRRADHQACADAREGLVTAILGARRRDVG